MGGCTSAPKKAPRDESPPPPRFLTGAADIRLCGTERPIGHPGPPLMVKLPRDEMHILAEELKRDRTTTLLDIGMNALDEKIALLGPSLAVNSTLVTLRIGCNNISPTTIAAIASALEKNSTLTCLTLPVNSLSAAGAHHLMQSLKVNTALKSLDLASNELRAEGGKVIADYLLSNRCCVNDLGLMGNALGDPGAIEISRGLECNPARLRSLDMRANDIDTAGGVAIAKSLLNNTVLTHLDLSNNKLGDCVGALEQLIMTNTTLTGLVLDHCTFRPVDAQRLLKAMQNNNATLEQLSLQGTDIGRTLRTAAQAQLVQRRETRIMKKQESTATSSSPLAQSLLPISLSSAPGSNDFGSAAILIPIESSKPPAAAAAARSPAPQSVPSPAAVSRAPVAPAAPVSVAPVSADAASRSASSPSSPSRHSPQSSPAVAFASSASPKLQSPAAAAKTNGHRAHSKKHKTSKSGKGKSGKKHHARKRGEAKQSSTKTENGSAVGAQVSLTEPPLVSFPPVSRAPGAAASGADTEAHNNVTSASAASAPLTQSVSQPRESSSRIMRPAGKKPARQSRYRTKVDEPVPDFDDMIEKLHRLAVDLETSLPEASSGAAASPQPVLEPPTATLRRMGAPPLPPQVAN